jgi:hypothetical protein
VTGYWRSAWPAEDGGPRRQQTIDGPGLDARRGHMSARSRDVLGGIMCVQRDPGELYFQGAVLGPASTAWVERIDPDSLECVQRVAELPAGPWWPGGILSHANGDLYVTQGRWCHRLTATLDLVASIELPRARPYNSLVALDDGRLVMKDMSSDDDAPSQLVVVDPTSMTVVTTHDLPEGTIARLSSWANTVCVVGTHSVFAIEVRGDSAREIGCVRYRTLDGQTFGWDAVITDDGSAWFLDNGDGTEAFSGSFAGQSSSSAPLHLVRTTWPPEADAPPRLHEVCGEPGGIVANPPIVHATVDGGLAVGYDSGHGVMTAWRWSAGSDGVERLWQRKQNHGAHSIHYERTGELVTFDYDLARGVDQCVVLDIRSGEELGRVDTNSPIQSVVFPCPGWKRDLYALTFTTLTRVEVR